MAVQRLHSNLAPIDILTRAELEAGLTKQFDLALRSRFRGIDSARFPAVMGQGNGATINLGGNTGTSDGYAGPEQGDVWMLRRANVISSAFTTDTARYILFRGSTPSDPGQYTNRQLLDLQATSGAYTTTTAPAVPLSTVPVQNPANQAYTVVVTGGVVTAVSVNGVPVGTGDGTYVVPPYGSISVTYSAAPTWTWTATTAFTVGQQVGIAYNPGTKYPLLQAGEQLYAQVLNSIVGNTYLLTGEAIRCPAEMKGKIL
jgi:hypothetical protein